MYVYIYTHSICDTKSAWCIVKLHKLHYPNLHRWNRELPPLNRHQPHNGGKSAVAPICQKQMNWSCSRHLKILSNDTSSCGGETHLWSQIIPGAYSKKTHLSKRANQPFCGTTNVFFQGGCNYKSFELWSKTLEKWFCMEGAVHISIILYSTIQLWKGL